MDNSTNTSVTGTTDQVWHVVELSLTMTPENPLKSKQCDDYEVHIVGEPHEIPEKIHQWLETEFKFPPGIKSAEVDSMHAHVIVRSGKISHSLASVGLNSEEFKNSRIAKENQASWPKSHQSQRSVAQENRNLARPRNPKQIETKHHAKSIHTHRSTRRRCNYCNLSGHYFQWRTWLYRTQSW